jgi:hypothetical protein
VPDRAFVSGSFGYVGGVTSTTTIAISNTEDVPLFQSERRWTGSAAPAYKFTVPNGEYEVTLKFAERGAPGPGSRVFTVKIEGVTVLSSFDIFAAAGSKNTAVERTFTTTVNHGVLHIAFVKMIGLPRLSAIAVIAKQ